MPFDQRAIIQEAVQRARKQMEDLFTKMVKEYPDVARRGAEALMVPVPTAADRRGVRQQLQQAGSVEELMRMTDEILAERSEQELMELMIPQRMSRSEPEEEDEVEWDAYGPRI